MIIDYVIGEAVAVSLLGDLNYALLRPERTSDRAAHAVNRTGSSGCFQIA
jgi:hypothetical protein